jgi:hypothetical protein
MPNVLYQVDDILYAEVVMELHLRQVEDASVNISIEYDRKRERKTWCFAEYSRLVKGMSALVYDSPEGLRPYSLPPLGGCLRDHEVFRVECRIVASEFGRQVPSQTVDRPSM